MGKDFKKDPPVNLILPSTTQDKMEAIVELSKAVNNLSKALISTNVEVTIANNVVTGDGGINVRSPESS